MNLLLDMNLSPRWAAYLNDHGINARHWSTIGSADADDAVIMAHAREHAEIVLTSDLDFGTLLALSGDAGPSVIQLRASILAPEAIGSRVRGCIGRFESQLEAGALLVIDDRNSKIRLLPFSPSD